MKYTFNNILKQRKKLVYSVITNNTSAGFKLDNVYLLVWGFRPTREIFAHVEMYIISLSNFSYPSRIIMLISSISCTVSKKRNMHFEVGYLAVFHIMKCIIC